MKRSILIAWSMALFLFCPSVSLQSMAQGKASEVLCSLTFELPKAFYAVKGNSATTVIRQIQKEKELIYSTRDMMI